MSFLFHFLQHYRAVLLIPDLFMRSHVKGMLDILLNRLGFSAAFTCQVGLVLLHMILLRIINVTDMSKCVVMLQDSVCATFGAGVMSACVVDVGDQKTSVCCVEDGLSLRQTRSVFWQYYGII